VPVLLLRAAAFSPFANPPRRSVAIFSSAHETDLSPLRISMWKYVSDCINRILAADETAEGIGNNAISANGIVMPRYSVLLERADA